MRPCSSARSTRATVGRGTLIDARGNVRVEADGGLPDDDPAADAEERAEFLETLGLSEPGLNKLIREAYHLLGLQTYFTVGPKEARAWVIHQGDTAPKAAGVIHSDFEKGFIKAEVVSFNDLVAAGSMAAAKSAGKVRIEGKDYVMVDGDVVEFRHGATTKPSK